MGSSQSALREWLQRLVELIAPIESQAKEAHASISLPSVLRALETGAKLDVVTLQPRESPGFLGIRLDSLTFPPSHAAPRQGPRVGFSQGEVAEVGLDDLDAWDIPRLRGGFEAIVSHLEHMRDHVAAYKEDIYELHLDPSSSDEARFDVGDGPAIAVPHPCLALDVLYLFADTARLNPPTAKAALTFEFCTLSYTPLSGRFTEHLAFNVEGLRIEEFAAAWEDQVGWLEVPEADDVAFYYAHMGRWREALAVVRHLLDTRDPEAEGLEGFREQWLDLSSEALTQVVSESDRRELLQSEPEAASVAIATEPAVSPEEFLEVLSQYLSDTEDIAFQMARDRFAPVMDRMGHKAWTRIVSATHTLNELDAGRPSRTELATMRQGWICLDLCAAVEAEWRHRVWQPYVEHVHLKERGKLRRMTAFRHQAEHMLRTPEAAAWIHDGGGEADHLKRVILSGDFALLRKGRNSHGHAGDFDDEARRRLSGFCRLGLSYGDSNWLLKFLHALPLP